MDETTSVGVPAAGSAVPLEERAALAEAVRESVRRSTLRLVRYLDPKGEARACPVCGDRVIHLDAPESFVFDGERNARICKACGAERDLVQITLPDADIGGEGG